MTLGWDERCSPAEHFERELISQTNAQFSGHRGQDRQRCAGAGQRHSKRLPLLPDASGACGHRLTKTEQQDERYMVRLVAIGMG